MEELSRLHKDVPFGWLAMLQDGVAAYRRRSAARKGVAKRPQARLGLVR